jgi:hypothetical protein
MDTAPKVNGVALLHGGAVTHVGQGPVDKTDPMITNQTYGNHQRQNQTKAKGKAFRNGELAKHGYTPDTFLLNEAMCSSKVAVWINQWRETCGFLTMLFITAINLYIPPPRLLQLVRL